jgi:hypothetical protein
MQEWDGFFSEIKAGGVGRLPMLRGAQIEEESHTFFPGLVSLPDIISFLSLVWRNPCRLFAFLFILPGFFLYTFSRVSLEVVFFSDRVQ